MDPYGMTPVESKTGMESIGFDPNTNTMRIVFRGKPYLYRGKAVTPELWDEFSNAPSKGSFFIKTIRNHAEITCIKEEEEERLKSLAESEGAAS